MKKTVRKVLLGLAAILIILQFFRGTPPEVVMNNSADLLDNHELPADVENLLQSACYDCHSNETSYPWYTYITPFSWIIFDHINQGREELNFSEWNNLRKSRRIRKLEDIQEEISEEKMPLKSYAWMHGEARLTKEERDLIVSWTKQFTDVVMKE